MKIARAADGLKRPLSIKTMLHIPILRKGVPYRSLDTIRTPHYRTREDFVEISLANVGLIRRDLLDQQTARDALADLSTAELMEWELEGKEPRARIRIKEGATLELRVVITQILRMGNDPNTGLPIYNVSWQPVISLVNSDKKLRKAALRQPGPGQGSAGTGMA